jgi:hypothetical protein
VKWLVNVVEGDKVEMSDGERPFPWSLVMSVAEAENLAYDLLDAGEKAAAYRDEPTEEQLEALNNPDSGPHGATYIARMLDAGRGGLLR